jgi:hypothetical protein
VMGQTIQRRNKWRSWRGGPEYQEMWNFSPKISYHFWVVSLSIAHHKRKRKISQNLWWKIFSHRYFGIEMVLNFYLYSGIFRGETLDQKNTSNYSIQMTFMVKFYPDEIHWNT